MKSTTLADSRLNLTTPDLEKVRTDLQKCLNDCAPYLAQYRHDFETRFCLWAGQARDGRRWQKAYGTDIDVRPWDGASDVRTFTADEIVNHFVAVGMSAFRRADVQVTALRSAALDTSSKVNLLLRWRFRSHLREEVDCELEKALQWRQTYGIAALGVWWRQARRLIRKQVVLGELIAQASQMMQAGDPSGAALVAQIADPMLDDKSAAQLRQMTQGIVDLQGAKKILRELRSKGEVVIPNVKIAVNQPCWEALRLFLDVFCPVDTPSFRQAKWTDRRRVLSAADLDEGVNTLGWDRDWAEEVWAQRGKSFNGIWDYRNGMLGNGPGRLTGGGEGMFSSQGYAGNGMEAEQVEVYDHFERGIDAATGVPVLTKLTYSPLVRDSYAHFDLFDYEHGQLPFVELVRERVENAMADSRSVPEIATTAQETIKKQRDSANDYTDLTTLPPLLTPSWRANSKIKLGPGAQIPERKAGELHWLPPPSTGANVALSVEDRQQMSLARYFGQPMAGLDPSTIQIAQQHFVGKFLTEVGAAVRMTLKLEQQYMDDVDAEYMSGGQPTRLSLTRAEIQGDFAIVLAFDARDLDQEQLKMKMEFYKDFLLAVDTEGVISRSKLVQLGARLLDPDIADMVVGTPQQASQHEADDEKNNLAQIASGIEPPMVPEGQNYALRLQTLVQALQTNPFLARRIGSQPDTYAILEARIKHLTQMAQQFGANAQIGRTGAQPGLQQLAETQAKGGALLQ